MSTKSENFNNQSQKKAIRFEYELLEAIEAAKDPLIPFGAWVKQACRDKLGKSVEVTTEAHQSTAKKTTTQAEREELIKGMHERGYDAHKIAERLNAMGFLPQRGSELTVNSVRSILKRIK